MSDEERSLFEHNQRIFRSREAKARIDRWAALVEHRREFNRLLRKGVSRG